MKIFNPTLMSTVVLPTASLFSVSNIFIELLVISATLFFLAKCWETWNLYKNQQFAKKVVKYATMAYFGVFGVLLTREVYEQIQRGGRDILNDFLFEQKKMYEANHRQQQPKKKKPDDDDQKYDSGF